MTLLLTALSFCMIFAINSYAVSAEDGGLTIPGSMYEFDEKNEYAFSADDAAAKTGISPYGTFSIKGDIIDSGTNGTFASYTVGKGDVTLSYTYTNTLLNAAVDEWHVADDGGKTVDTIKLDKKIQHGAMILQTSKDGTKWVDELILTNAFESEPVRTEPFYTTKGVQLSNGCYYRVIVAYELAMQTQAAQVFPPKLEKNDYKKYAEVYEFYLSNSEATTIDANTKRYNLNNKKVNTGKDNGFDESVAKEIDVKDPHYGWEIGQFFISGYTSDTKDAEGNSVFLKNVGDKVTLYFNLSEDISKLNGDSALSIAVDDNGYDKQFEIPKTNFGHGALIIQYTDYENIKHSPTIYTNYLEASASTGADTVVELFEEGDYEVALDYEIKNDKHVVLGQSIMPEYTDYRIHFKFSVRNGNCMVFPFDVTTGNELTNTSITENGFRLDLARSRYLDIFLKKEVLVEGANGLTEDTRFNRTAKDGDQYTDEGIYTITVSNRYTKQETTKVIYVGSNPTLKAVVMNGLTYDEIQTLISEGASINEDGTIVRPMKEEENNNSRDNSNTSSSETTSTPADKNEQAEKKDFPIIPIAAGVGVVAAAVIIATTRKKKIKESNVIDTETNSSDVASNEDEEV